MSSDYEVIKIDIASEDDINREIGDPVGTFQVPYSDWQQKNKVLDVYEIPIEFCFFRKENGRIRSEVLSHEKDHGPLFVKDPETQEILKNFLKNSDSTKNIELKKYLKEQGQTEPAVITADGFLINGNRRKMALTDLYEETGDLKYKKIKVCILPGTDKPEQPTPLLITLLEHRFQARGDGKSEYTNMNKALTAKKSLSNEVKLETLLQDDPAFASTDEKQFKKNMELFKRRYLKPLELMDQYLEYNKIEQKYELVKDRWDAFAEAQNYISGKLDNINFMLENEFDDSDKAQIIQAVFNIIKLNHKDSYEIERRRADIVRDVFRRYAKADKQELLKLGSIDVGAQSNSDPVSSYEEWQNNEGQLVLNSLKKLKNKSAKIKEKETPVDRLEEALSKLTNNKVWGEGLGKTIDEKELAKAQRLTIDLQRAVKKLYNLFQDYENKYQEFQDYIDEMNQHK